MRKTSAAAMQVLTLPLLLRACKGNAQVPLAVPTLAELQHMLGSARQPELRTHRREGSVGLGARVQLYALGQRCLAGEDDLEAAAAVAGAGRAG